MAGISFDLSKYFGGKGVIPMSGMVLGIAGYFALNRIANLDQFDSGLARFGFALLCVLAFIAIGEIKAPDESNKSV